MKQCIVRAVDMDDLNADELETALERTDNIYKFEAPDNADEATIRLLAFGTLFENDWDMRNSHSDWYVINRPQTSNKK